MAIVTISDSKGCKNSLWKVIPTDPEKYHPGVCAYLLRDIAENKYIKNATLYSLAEAEKFGEDPIHFKSGLLLHTV